jgi:hypothetical protein
MTPAAWEATEASVQAWERADGIDWATASGPVRPPLVGRLPAESSH